jgi:hypothetical protein
VEIENTMTNTKKYKIENFDAVKAERDRMMLALHDIQNDRIAYGDWCFEAGHSKEGKYRAGLSRMDSCPLLTLIWRCAGQSDSITVWDAEQYEAELRRLNYSASDDACLRAICSAKVAVARKSEAA